MDAIKSMYVNAICKKALTIDKTQKYFETPESRLNRLLNTVEQVVYVCSH